jgi:hypothetical protein
VRTLDVLLYRLDQVHQRLSLRRLRTTAPAAMRTDQVLNCQTDHAQGFDRSLRVASFSGQLADRGF